MENSVLIIGAVVFLVFFLILYFVKQNKKDKKELEKMLNNDYKKIDNSDEDQNSTLPYNELLLSLFFKSLS